MEEIRYNKKILHIKNIVFIKKREIFGFFNEKNWKTFLEIELMDKTNKMPKKLMKVSINLYKYFYIK